MESLAPTAVDGWLENLPDLSATVSLVLPASALPFPLHAPYVGWPI